MSTWLIVNPKAGSVAKNEELVAQASASRDLVVVQTEAPGHAEQLAREACLEGADRVIAAGGDGTVNEVLNGIAGNLDQVSLGVLPLGTGNDIARTLGIPDDPELALPYLLGADDVRKVDLMRVSNPERSRLALNHVNAGYSNQITEQITADMKRRWGPLAYLKEAASQLREREDYHIRLRWDDGAVEVVDAVNVLVVNGRTVAGGLRVAPEASLEDAVLQSVVLLSGSLVDLAGMAAKMLVGRLLQSDHVISRPARSLHIESSPPMVFSVDGEPFCEHGVDIRVLPAALRAVVGPHYVIEPAVSEQED